MKVGTVELIPERDDADPRRKRSRRVGGGPGGSGGGNDDGGGGDREEPNRSRFEDYPDTQDEVPDKSKFVAWFLLVVVLMTFGGMIGAYIVISTNRAAEWQPFNLPFQVWLSTALIAASSVTYHLAKTALFGERFQRSRQLLIATTVLGAAFISSQILVWLALVNRGFYMQGDPYAGFFYILTAAHAVHVLGGIIALGVVLLRTWNDTRLKAEFTYRRNLTRAIGWYWHFMGGLWIVLLMLLGFWKQTVDALYVFPHLNAVLNASASVFLVCGFIFILKKNIRAHRFCMLSACTISLLFLVSYVTHHALRTYYFGIGPTTFKGTGLARPVYFTILTSHTVFAALLVPFVLATLFRALKGRFDEHKRLARLVYPVWLYVSITGVTVYLMLYQIYSE